MVLTFGGGAKYVGLLAASAVSAVVYGVLGIFFERYYAPFAAKIRYLTDLERFLLYSLVPWVFFGLIILPLSGVGVFGTASLNQGYNWLYPYTLLLTSAFYGAVLSRTYRGAYPFRGLTESHRTRHLRHLQKAVRARPLQSLSHVQGAGGHS